MYCWLTWLTTVLRLYIWVNNARHQAITWTNVEFSSVGSCGIHLKLMKEITAGHWQSRSCTTPTTSRIPLQCCACRLWRRLLIYTESDMGWVAFDPFFYKRVYTLDTIHPGGYCNPSFDDTRLHTYVQYLITILLWSIAKFLTYLSNTFWPL